MGDNLRKLGNQISVAMHADEDGYFAESVRRTTIWAISRSHSARVLKDLLPATVPIAVIPAIKTHFSRRIISTTCTPFSSASDLKSLEFGHKPRGPFGIRHQHEGAAVGAPPDSLLPREEAGNSRRLR
jgi:hypothetical protein